MSGVRTGLRRALAVVAVLAVVVVGASSAQLAMSQYALGRFHADVRSSLSADDPCVGARAMLAADCTDRHRLPGDVDPALSAMDVGIVEGTAPFLEGCAHRIIGTDVLNKHCVWTNPGATTTVALVGDSHAAQWADALRAVAPERGWNVEVYYHGGCLLSDVEGTPAEAAAEKACRSWSAWVDDELAGRDDLDVVLYGARTSLYVDDRVKRVAGFDAATASADVVAAASRSISRWKDSVDSVVVLQDTPDPGMDVPPCLTEHALRKDLDDACRAALRPHDPDVAVDARGPLNDDESPRIADGLGLPLLSTTDLFCDARECHTSIGGIPVYRDDDHITASFALTAADAFAARLLEAIATDGDGGGRR
jgi:hypothetical protein